MNHGDLKKFDGSIGPRRFTVGYFIRSFVGTILAGGGLSALYMPKTIADFVPYTLAEITQAAPWVLGAGIVLMVINMVIFVRAR